MVARQVLATDPAVLRDLATARLGTAYFRRLLWKVRDDEFAAPSLLPGWQRNQLVAHVGYNARAVSRLVAWAATGMAWRFASETMAAISSTDIPDELIDGMPWVRYISSARRSS